MIPPATFELRVRHESLGEVRAVTGFRWEIERDNLRLPIASQFRHPALGEGWASGGYDLDRLAVADVLDWELEIGDAGPELVSTLPIGLGPLLPPDAAHELAELAAALETDPMPWHAGWLPIVPPALHRRGAAYFDVLVPSVNWRMGDATADPVVHFRHARFVWAPTWCVTVWSARQGAEESEYRTWGLPDRWGLPTTATGTSGVDRLARWLQAVVGHIQWSVGMIDVELESWENHFLEEAAAEGGLLAGPDLGRLQRHLAGLGRGIAFNREALRTLVRRGEFQPGFPISVRPDVDARCAQLIRQSEKQRGAVRESFDLVAGATVGQQFRLAQVRAERDGAFQAAVGILAAVFVAPGLIAAFYGANVRGLPGYDTERGLWFLLGGAVIAALTSIAMIFGVRAHSRRNRA